MVAEPDKVLVGELNNYKPNFGEKLDPASLFEKYESVPRFAEICYKHIFRHTYVIIRFYEIRKFV